MITEEQHHNAQRIMGLADTLGHLPINDHGQTTKSVLNLSIPCARLILAGIVTGVADTNDGLNDNAVAEIERYCQAAVAYATLHHGQGWWNQTAAQLGL